MVPISDNHVGIDDVGNNDDDDDIDSCTIINEILLDIKDREMDC